MTSAQQESLLGPQMEPKSPFMWHQKRPQDHGEIYTLNRDGTGLQELVNHPEQGVTASVWDPDGKALIYSQQVGKWERHIFKIMLADGTSEQLTDVSLNNPRRLVRSGTCVACLTTTPVANYAMGGSKEAELKSVFQRSL